MPLNLEHTRTLLQAFDFKALFIEELGWDRFKTELDVSADGQKTFIRIKELIKTGEGYHLEFKRSLDKSFPRTAVRADAKIVWNKERRQEPCDCVITASAGYIEKIGTGIKRIEQAVKEHGRGSVTFSFDPFFTASFSRTRTSQKTLGDTTQKTTQETSGKTSGKIVG